MTRQHPDPTPAAPAPATRSLAFAVEIDLVAEALGIGDRSPCHPLARRFAVSSHVWRCRQCDRIGNAVGMLHAVQRPGWPDAPGSTVISNRDRAFSSELLAERGAR